MKNLLIVESDNDKYFVEALINHLNIGNIEISNGYINVCKDDFECLGDLSATKLKTVLLAVKAKVKKENIQRVGIIIDQDNVTVAERIALINDCIKEVFNVSAIFIKTGELKSVPIDDKQNVEISTYFTNVNNQGDLETVLRHIKKGSSTYADCLECWQNCLNEKNKALKQKDFDKFWVQVFMRYDQCTKNEQTQAGRKCNNEVSLKEKPIWNFDDECLSDFKKFLNLFK
jgi:hypothetical protein